MHPARFTDSALPFTPLRIFYRLRMLLRSLAFLRCFAYVLLPHFRSNDNLYYERYVYVCLTLVGSAGNLALHT